MQTVTQKREAETLTGKAQDLFDARQVWGSGSFLWLLRLDTARVACPVVLWLEEQDSTTVFTVSGSNALSACWSLCFYLSQGCGHTLANRTLTLHHGLLHHGLLLHS